MSEDEVKLLHIKRLERNDSGSYLCRVLNEYGHADLLHHVTVLPGTCVLRSNKPNVCFSLSRVASERPLLTNNLSMNTRRSLSTRLPDELMITIACVVGIILFAFIFFLIYHFRNQKSLRRTLIATRILATRGISNLKTVNHRQRRGKSTICISVRL